MSVFKRFKDALVVGDEGNWLRFEVEAITFLNSVVHMYVFYVGVVWYGRGRAIGIIMKYIYNF